MASKGKRRQEEDVVARPALPSRRSARHKKEHENGKGTISAPIVIDSSPMVPKASIQVEDEVLDSTVSAVQVTTSKNKKDKSKGLARPKASSAKRKQEEISNEEDEDNVQKFQSKLLNSKKTPGWLPKPLPARLEGLTDAGNRFLYRKQKKLKIADTQVHYLDETCDRSSPSFHQLQNAVASTLVFAQEEAGTAICISPTGLLLTCSHCVAETPDTLDLSKSWWLLFSSGRVVQAKTVKYDPIRDLALLRIVAAEEPAGGVTYDFDSFTEPTLSFPYIDISDFMAIENEKLVCIGHPGSEDLEADVPGRKTGYDVLHISAGAFRGYSEGQDVHDNSEIGALMHDCWTYWGHSGAPLVRRGKRSRKIGEWEEEVGELVGLHSSWDDETGMRRGVGLEAVKVFLEGVVGFQGGVWRKGRQKEEA